MQINLRSKFVENQLNCELPVDYSKFLNKYGYSIIDNNEIFGYTFETIDIEKIPCVIGATHIFRKINRINKSEIAIYTSDELLYGYNFLKKEYFIKDRENNYHKAQSVFENIQL